MLARGTAGLAHHAEQSVAGAASRAQQPAERTCRERRSGAARRSGERSSSAGSALSTPPALPRPSPRPSACPQVPCFDWRVLRPAVRRIDLGGKALTNYMKELVSYRWGGPSAWR